MLYNVTHHSKVSMKRFKRCWFIFLSPPNMGLRGLELKLGCIETLKTQTHSRLSYSLISNPLGPSFHTALTMFSPTRTHKIHFTWPLLWDRMATASPWNSLALSQWLEVAHQTSETLSVCLSAPVFLLTNTRISLGCALSSFQTQPFEGVPQGAELGLFGISLKNLLRTFSQKHSWELQVKPKVNTTGYHVGTLPTSW